jgi:hypothetical protein
MGSYVSWGQLVAASGLVAVAALHIDENRIGVWSCSGHVPTALSVLTQDSQNRPNCAVPCYPYTLDTDGSTGVADAVRQWGLVNPCAGKSVSDLPRDVPLLIVRAGQDQMPGLNETLDRFVDKALACNLPVTFVNHAAAPHAFGLFHDSETSREIIRHILAFLQFHLLNRHP